MNKTAPRIAVGVGVAFLVFVSSSGISRANLRDEAVTYREEGYEWQQKGDFARALTAYQKAEALNPHDPILFNYVGTYYEQRGLLEAARQAYMRALAIDPSYLDAMFHLAVLYERMGHREAATNLWIEYARRVKETDPWNLRAEEQLVALGVLKSGELYQRYVMEQELQAHRKSLNQFHTVTERQRGQ